MRALQVFCCIFVCSYAPGLAVSQVRAQKDTRSQLRAMAHELQEVLPSVAKPPEQLEPAFDQPKEDKKEQEIRRELLAATSLFNSASSENTEEQQAVEDALRKAMASPSQVGPADRNVQDIKPTACLPDFTQCPKGWIKEGVLCRAADTYSGQCAVDVDLSEMTAEQKLAFAKACSVDFPCQDDCAQDFKQACPSLWREIGRGICSAPLEYEGTCSMRLDVTNMSQEEKYTWSVHCGARWPCTAPRHHNYADVCPEGWSLGVGQVCVAPQTYHGPCEHTAHMTGMTAKDKKTFEATCHVKWPQRGDECVFDFGAACPFGWYDDGAVCVAPLTYDVCSNRKSFRMMTPAAKEDWAQNCAVRFPCQNRGGCNRTYLAPCPADWYAFNGGTSCAAPSEYAGPCKPVLSGLLDMSTAEKMALEGKCDVHWPCSGEIYASVLQVTRQSMNPRRRTD